MQYAVLIYERPDAYEGYSEEEALAIRGEYLTIRGQDPRLVGGAGLQPVETATTVRVQNGETLVTDGPFADTKEVFAGFYLFEADDSEGIDAAIEVAARLPAARMGGSIEIRPLVPLPVPVFDQK
ncbi:MAG: YciI family protein [Mycobacteriales bacterium]